MNQKMASIKNLPNICFPAYEKHTSGENKKMSLFRHFWRKREFCNKQCNLEGLLPRARGEKRARLFVCCLLSMRATGKCARMSVKCNNICGVEFIKSQVCIGEMHRARQYAYILRGGGSGEDLAGFARSVKKMMSFLSGNKNPGDKALAGALPTILQRQG